MKHTEKWWGLVNAGLRGRPILVPDSIRTTKKAVLEYPDEWVFRAAFTIVRVTVTFEAPDAP